MGGRGLEVIAAERTTEERNTVGAAAPPPARASRWADRLARLASLTLVAMVALGLLAGSVVALIHRPEVDWTVYNIPYMIQNLGYLLVLALSLPSLVVGAWDLFRGRWARGTGGLLAFVGPLLVILGSEGLVSHGLLGCAVMTWACADGDFTVRWHQLHHTLVAGLPLAALYWLALRRWRPAIARFGRPARLRVPADDTGGAVGSTADRHS